MHNNPNVNTPAIRSELIHHGHDPDKPSLLADAFRPGWLTAQPDWERALYGMHLRARWSGLDCSETRS